ncbi:unconventional prefoldin RPB5 interactor [Vanessa atalanta]|uniref:unconventional prefoldin RPB5 interactor n=1 Tax=Vanessa atalanta TaxID=42275 RepID=UPI001FCE1BCB|nr:unconventional prefoldin RPB5 interactor [Vanessa atalanta]
MNILRDIYRKSLLENEKNIQFWEDYLQNLNNLDFTVYCEKLKVPILVPIGNKILFRGDLKHTNEVTVALGADYFTKCSIKQAEILRQHRIKDAKSKLEEYYKEKGYLEKQVSFGEENLYENAGQNLIEVCSEEEDMAWRKHHKEKVKQYKQNNSKTHEDSKNQMTDEELWLRLEELELQEELENELEHTTKHDSSIDESEENSYDSFIIKEDDISNIETEKKEQQEAHITHNIPKQTSKIDLLEQVIDRQKMLEIKLTEIKNRQRVPSKTENDLLSRLDEIEQLDELEDEMERLDDILEESSDDGSEHGEKSNSIKKSITFADEEDNDTIDINFKHSDFESSKDSYDPKKGITKPSDIYDAFPNLFANATISILRKSKYGNVNIQNDNLIYAEMQNKTRSIKKIEKKTICINDVIEKTDQKQNKVDSEDRPKSLFKKRRQQQKL